MVGRVEEGIHQAALPDHQEEPNLGAVVALAARAALVEAPGKRLRNIR